MKAGTSRRGFLAAAGAGAAAVAAGGLLSGCGAGEVKAKLLFQGTPPTPVNPVLWPIHLNNLPIAGAQRPEADATLRVYCWPGRVGINTLNDFGHKFKCQVELRTFESMSEAIATLARNGSQVDVLLGATIDALSSFIDGKLLQPVNHDYITNIGAVWPQYTNPYYDQNWQYTVPYTIYTTGIGWRKDLIDANPFALANGWDVLWNAKYHGKVSLLNNYREGISLGLLKTGATDLETPDPRLIDAAGSALSELAGLVRPSLSNTAYRQLGTGKVAMAHAWSGQVAGAAKYLPPGTSGDVLGYWFPPNGAGPVANDTMTIPRYARNPVLAHLFVNFLLGKRTAVNNVRDTGFMQPLTWMTPERLIHEGAIPSALITATVLENYFYRGLKELQLQIGAQALWNQEWHSVVQQLNRSR